MGWKKFGVQNKFWVQKNFGSKKIWGPKNFGSKKMLGPKLSHGVMVELTVADRQAGRKPLIGAEPKNFHENVCTQACNKCAHRLFLSGIPIFNEKMSESCILWIL